MDFTKFVSLLNTQKLFFSRADSLTDEFEGSYPKQNIESRSIVYKDAPNAIKDHPFIAKEMRKYVAISSWHTNDHESAAMWKVYIQDSGGIAIQSTFEKLCASFEKDKENEVFIGKVKYIDYEVDSIPEGNFFFPYLHKRKSFEYENEVRAIVLKLPEEPNTLELDLTIEVFQEGLYIPVDLNTLVENIHVSPKAKKWYLKLVETTLKKYLLNKPIKQSKLDEGPLY